ncbi:flagellar motor stator protein MotA [Desulfovibrio sp. X2]|uniref:flagellar motor stator protein MotA n=1 Tax=Desulfovibrio sp. X2 TaxID=941449 RepID=UPI000358AF67|nr:flagellar motor stator protein MotA [Desulfovibrio sp. X2]EPR43374.1 flagellar motor stator protein MotA [Desulfovibrio sp. X2]
MFSLIGFFVVLGAVIGGYLVEGGNMHVLFQPAEVMIIGGAALGAFIIASPKAVFFGTLRKIPLMITSKDHGKTSFLEVLYLLFEFLSLARREGMLALEPHVNKPESSPIIQKYGHFAKDHEMVDFLCDNIKVLLASNMEPHQFDDLMDLDIDTQAEHELVSPAAMNMIADSLPGLGIVAAVLGVVLTMGKIKEPPEVLGHSIGAALVGTFLGILMSYGFVGPIAKHLEHLAHERTIMRGVIKAALSMYAKGMAPFVAVEAGRRAVPGEHRPTFSEVEEGCKRAKG